MTLEFLRPDLNISLGIAERDLLPVLEENGKPAVLLSLPMGQGFRKYSNMTLEQFLNLNPEKRSQADQNASVHESGITLCFKNNTFVKAT